MLLEVGGFLLPGPAQVPDGGQDLEARGDRAQDEVEPDLVVAGGGRAVSDRAGPPLEGDPRHGPGLRDALGRDAEGVDPALQQIALHDPPHEVVEDLLAQVEPDVFGGAQPARRAADLLDALRVEATGVAGDGDHLGALLAGQVDEAEAGVEPARVGQDDLLGHGRAPSGSRRISPGRLGRYGRAVPY